MFGWRIQYCCIGVDRSDGVSSSLVTSRYDAKGLQISYQMFIIEEGCKREDIIHRGECNHILIV